MRWTAGTARALEGIPFGLKDIIAIAGVPTAAGAALSVVLALGVGVAAVAGWMVRLPETAHHPPVLSAPVAAP